MADPTDPKKPEKDAQKKKPKRHAEFLDLSPDQIERARAEGATVLIMSGCACVVEGDGVYGKLVVL